MATIEPRNCVPQIVSTEWTQAWNCSFTTCSDLSNICGPYRENTTLVGNDQDKTSGEALGNVYCFYSPSFEEGSACATQSLGSRVGLPFSIGSVFNSSDEDLEVKNQQQVSFPDSSERTKMSGLVWAMIGMTALIQIVNTI